MFPLMTVVFYLWSIVHVMNDFAAPLPWSSHLTFGIIKWIYYLVSLNLSSLRWMKESFCLPNWSLLVDGRCINNVKSWESGKTTFLHHEVVNGELCSSMFNIKLQLISDTIRLQLKTYSTRTMRHAALTFFFLVYKFLRHFVNSPNRAPRHNCE